MCIHSNPNYNFNNGAQIFTIFVYEKREQRKMAARYNAFNDIFAGKFVPVEGHSGKAYVNRI